MSAMNLESWTAEGRQLEKAGRASQWQIADWIAAGEKQFKKKAYPEAQAIFGLSRQTLYNMVSTATAFPISRRREILKFAHHVEVRALPPDQQDALLDRVVKEDLKISALRKIVRPPDPNKKKLARTADALWQQPLKALAAYRKISVEELKDTIYQVYFELTYKNRKEMEAAGCVIPEGVIEVIAAPVADAPDQPEVDEQAAKKARMDALLAEVLA